MARLCGVEIPEWLDQEISLEECLSINESGCGGAAYRPAIIDAEALETMAKHGDEIFEYLIETFGALPEIVSDSWRQMATDYVSAAVEVWCSQFYEDSEEEGEEEEEEE